MDSSRNICHQPAESALKEIQAQYLELDNKVNALRIDLFSIQNQNRDVCKDIERIKFDTVSKTTELELLQERKRGQSDQIALLEDLRSELSREWIKNDVLLKEKANKYKNIIAHYDAIWEDYQKTYDQFPLVFERNSLAKKVKYQEIMRKLKQQEVLETRRKAQELKTIRAHLGKILSAEVRELYKNNQEMREQLQRIVEEIHDQKALLNQKEAEKMEHEQRMLTSEENKMKMLKNGTPDGDILTPDNLPKWNVMLDFDDELDDFSEITIQPSRISGNFSEGLPSISRRFATHFSQPPPKSILQPTRAMLQSPTKETPNIAQSDSQDARNPPSMDVDAQPSTLVLAQTSQISTADLTCTAPDTPENLRRKKEQMIRTDDIGAKLRDLTQKRNLQLYSFSDHSEMQHIESDEQSLPSSQDMFGSQDNADEEPLECSTDSPPQLNVNSWTDNVSRNETAGIAGNSSTDNKQVERDSLASEGGALEPSDRTEGDAYAGNTDYDELYDECSFEPPPNFHDVTSPLCAEYMSPILSPASVASSDNVNDKGFSGFNFFPSTTNVLFGGSNTSENSKDEQQKTPSNHYSFLF